jgi:uncharacterized small protein (DUF1192 family)
VSQPKRYRTPTFCEKMDASPEFLIHDLVECEDGNLVSYGSYAALQADLNQMTAWGRDLVTELRLAKEANAALKAETVKQLESAIPPVEAYIGKLEAEVERLTKERDHYQWASTNDGIACNERARENQELENQIAALKAENERLKAFSDEAQAHISKEERKSRERLDMAQSENDRLRKAGDAMVEIVHGTYCVTPPQALIDWRAAKEVQS